MMYLRSGVIGLSEIPDRFKTDDWFDDVLGRKGDYIYSAFRKVKLQDNDYFELFRRGNRILLEFYKLDSTPDHIKSHIRKRYPPFLLQDSEQQTRELCVEAIKTDPKCIQHIRKQTRSLRSLVIDIDGMTLKHIWKKDYYLCLRAVKDNGMALEFVPRRFKSPQMCFQAVRTTARALALVPDRLKTEKMCLQAVRRNGDTLEFVPDRLKTKKVCHAAVDDNPIALKYISLEDQTDEMYQLVKFNRYIKALSYVYRQTEEMCLKLVKENNLALMYVHDQTEEICIESVKNDYFSFRDIRNPSDDLVIKILEMKHECILSIKENCSDSVFKTILSICRGDLKKLELVYDKNLLSRVIETLADEFGTR